MLRYELLSPNNVGGLVNIISSGCHGSHMVDIHKSEINFFLESTHPVNCGKGYNCADYDTVETTKVRLCCCEQSFCNKKENVMLSSSWVSSNWSPEKELHIDQFKIIIQVSNG